MVHGQCKNLYFEVVYFGRQELNYLASNLYYRCCYWRKFVRCLSVPILATKMYLFSLIMVTTSSRRHWWCWTTFLSQVTPCLDPDPPLTFTVVSCVTKHTISQLKFSHFFLVGASKYWPICISVQTIVQIKVKMNVSYNPHRCTSKVVKLN